MIYNKLIHQFSPNILCNDKNVAFGYTKDFFTTSDNEMQYNCNNASIEQISIQNPLMGNSNNLPVNLPNMTFNSPLIQESHSEIITCKIPGYDVIFIPKSSHM